MQKSTLPEGFVGAYRDVIKENERQMTKWGQQNHNPLVWMSILGEEVGETHQALLRTIFAQSEQDHITHLCDYRQEMVQVAAVAIAALECMDRMDWDWDIENKPEYDQFKEG